MQVAPGEHLDDGLPSGSSSSTARPTGKVVGIIKRNWRTRGYCGSLQPQEERGGRGAQGVLFCPVERRYPKIRLQTRQVGLELGFIEMCCFAAVTFATHGVPSGL